MNRGTNEIYEVYKYILKNRCNSIKNCFESVDIYNLFVNPSSYVLYEKHPTALRGAMNAFG